MKIVVLGGGVIGVTTAWYLAKDGHEVTVIDRNDAVGADTTFANAGQISPGYSAPWAAPGVPLKAIKWMFQRHAPLIVQPRLDWAKVSWMARMLRNCTEARYEVNKGRMVRLAEYSRDCLMDISNETEIEYDHREKGTLQLFRTQKQVDGAAKDINVLKKGGVPYEVLDTDGCIKVEPGLANARDLIAGGLRLPGDQTGDCHTFTTKLAELMAETMGVTFKNGVEVHSLVQGVNGIEAAETSEGRIAADVFVVAMGNHSPSLVQPLGLKLPIYPVKGYSITAPIVAPERAPESTVMDETYKIAITRLGDRVRVGGLAELAGMDRSLKTKRQATLTMSVESLFGGAADQSRAVLWAGLRPMTPDGTPIIGQAGARNLFLNTGHGTLGWTMAAGSARVVTDLIAGRSTDIESADLSYDRYVSGTEPGARRSAQAGT